MYKGEPQEVAKGKGWISVAMRSRRQRKAVPTDTEKSDLQPLEQKGLMGRRRRTGCREEGGRNGEKGTKRLEKPKLRKLLREKTRTSRGLEHSRKGLPWVTERGGTPWGEFQGEY